LKEKQIEQVDPMKTERKAYLKKNWKKSRLEESK
jgi:hypothetical protein